MIVQLIPARFLYGEDIFKWSRAGWAALAVTAMTVYMVIVVRPNPNQQSFGNLWFVLGLVAVALLFWTWATFHHRKLMREKARPKASSRPPAAEPACRRGSRAAGVAPARISDDRSRRGPEFAP